MPTDKNTRPWWYGDNLPWPILILLYPVYLMAMAVAMPIVIIGMLFGLHLPRDKNGKRIWDGPGTGQHDPSWMGRDPGPDIY